MRFMLVAIALFIAAAVLADHLFYRGRYTNAVTNFVMD